VLTIFQVGLGSTFCLAMCGFIEPAADIYSRSQRSIDYKFLAYQKQMFLKIIEGSVDNIKFELRPCTTPKSNVYCTPTNKDTHSQTKPMHQADSNAYSPITPFKPLLKVAHGISHIACCNQASEGPQRSRPTPCIYATPAYST
jgi:hypothetical protein